MRERFGIPERTLQRRTLSTRKMLALGTLAAALTAALPRPASAADLPQLNMPASPEHHVGKRIFAELVTPDLAAAKDFYAKLLGWTFQDYTQRDASFTLALLDGQVVGGIYQRPLPEGAPPRLDLLHRHHRCRRNRRPGHPERRQAAAIAAPLGQSGPGSNSGGPARAPSSRCYNPAAATRPTRWPPPGDWIWSSLIATDPATDGNFYKTVFGYDIYNLPDPQDAQHLILASDNFARASINPIPPTWENAKPRWLNYLRVDDVTRDKRQSHLARWPRGAAAAYRPPRRQDRNRRRPGRRTLRAHGMAGCGTRGRREMNPSLKTRAALYATFAILAAGLSGCAGGYYGGGGGGLRLRRRLLRHRRHRLR